jgi:hypothetical protein
MVSHMAIDPSDGVVDSLTLRFTGKNEDGTDVHELRAAHVAEVLQGLVGLSSDFDKAGAFHAEGPANSEILVRPAEEGSFLIEVVRVVVDNWAPIAAVGGTVGVPSLATIIWWATKSVRAGVKDFDRLENGMVKVIWQDDTAQEIPAAAWDELQKRTPRRKKQLRQIMAPLADTRVSALDVSAPDSDAPAEEGPATYVLSKPDYDAVKPDSEIEETQNIFEVEAQMSAIDFDDPSKWKVKTKDRTRSATVEDSAFLTEVAGGLAIRKADIFRLKIREDTVTKNGRGRTHWTVLHVESHRRSAGDDDS